MIKIDRDVEISGKTASLKFQTPKMREDMQDVYKRHLENLKEGADMEEKTAEFYRELSAVMFTFKDGLPEIEFFKDANFEYGKVLAFQDFLFPSGK